MSYTILLSENNHVEYIKNIDNKLKRPREGDTVLIPLQSVTNRFIAVQWKEWYSKFKKCSITYALQFKKDSIYIDGIIHQAFPKLQYETTSFEKFINYMHSILCIHSINEYSSNSEMDEILISYGILEISINDDLHQLQLLNVSTTEIVKDWEFSEIIEFSYLKENASIKDRIVNIARNGSYSIERFYKHERYTNSIGIITELSSTVVFLSPKELSQYSKIESVYVILSAHNSNIYDTINPEDITLEPSEYIPNDSDDLSLQVWDIYLCNLSFLFDYFDRLPTFCTIFKTLSRVLDREDDLLEDEDSIIVSALLTIQTNKHSITVNTKSIPQLQDILNVL